MLASSKSQFILLTILCLFLFFTGLNNYGLLDRDEPRYAGCALEMIENNDWITPKFNFQDRFDKPVLFYWLIATSYKFLGVSDFTSRLPSAISATLLVLFTWFTTRKVFGKSFGLVAGVMLASAAEFIILGRRAATDIVLCLLLSGTLYSCYLSYHFKDKKQKLFWMISSGVFLGLALLTKGPIGLLLTLGVLFFFTLYSMKFDIRHLIVYSLIVIISLIVCAPWYFAVHKATNGEFTNVFFIHHNFQRFTDVVSRHEGPPWFYIPIILGGFMPWTLFFLYSLPNLFKKLLKRTVNKFIAYNLIWFLLVFGFFSVSTTKLATYIILAFPPIAILTSYWTCIIYKKKRGIIKSLFLATSLIFLAASIFAKGMVTDSSLSNLEQSFLIQRGLISIIALIVLFACTFIFSKKITSLSINFAFSLAIPAILLINSYLPIYYKHTHTDLRNIAIFAKENKLERVTSFYYKPSLVYYSRVPVEFGKRNVLKKQVKKKSLSGEKVYFVSRVSDIKKHPKYYRNVKVLESGERFFLGTF